MSAVCVRGFEGRADKEENDKAGHLSAAFAGVRISNGNDLVCVGVLSCTCSALADTNPAIRA